MRRAIVLRTDCPVRGSPEESGEPLGHLKRGERVEVIELGDGWIRTAGAAAEGFIRAGDLALVDATGSGRFLAADPALEETPVELPAAQRLAPASNATPRERAVLRAWNLYGGLLGTLAERVEIDPACAVAVVCVESSGHGFGPDGRTIIRFENHIFRRRLAEGQRERFARHFAITGDQPWLGHLFRADPSEPWAAFHGSQSREWRVFEFACDLDERAAHEAISMGLPQIMGFNHEHIGFDRPQAMLAYFDADVRYQLLSLFDFVGGLRRDAPALRALRRGDYGAFASLYNGPGQAQYYGELISAHVEDFRRARSRASSGGAASHAVEAASTPGGGEGRQYEVRPGDTLGAIAGRFGVTVDALARVNGIANPNVIRAGQRLEVPASEPAPRPPAVPSRPPEEVSADDEEQRVHVIQPGETLGRLAQRYHVTVRRIAEANGIADPDRIFAGQVLTIPSKQSG